MKRIFLGLAAVAAVASCVTNDFNSDGVTNAPSVEAGISTHATFTFKSNTSSTRALPTDSGETDYINSGKLLIFDMDDDNLSYIGDIVLGGSTTVATLSGEKRIFVVVNAEANPTTRTSTTTEAEDLLAKLEADVSTLSDFYALMTNKKEGDDAITGVGTYFAEITAAGNTLMSNGSSLESKYIIQPDITYADSNDETNKDDVDFNNFTIYVKRAVAKAKLSVLQSLVQSDAVKTEDELVSLKYTAGSDMPYSLRNLNRSTFVSQQFANDTTSDNDAGAIAPNAATMKTRPWAPYYETFKDLAYEALTTDLFEQYYFDEAFEITMGSDDFNYIPENSSAAAMVGNSTYWGIEATVSNIAAAAVVSKIELANGEAAVVPVADRVYRFTNSTDENGDYIALNDNTFYSIRVNQLTGGEALLGGDELRYFTSKSLAFEMLYILLESAGHIGTPANTDTTLGDGITVADNAKYGQALYFADLDTFISGYDAAIEAINTNLEAAAKNDSSLPDNLDYVLGIYTDAKCYYRLNIYEQIGSEQYNLVRRNHSYAGTVTGFKTIGVPTAPELEKDPGDLIDKTQTYVTANIEVQDWRIVTVEGAV